MVDNKGDHAMKNDDESLIEEFAAPYNRIVKMEKITHESGMQMLRMRIREGRRFTIIDLDKETAQKMGQHMLTWIEGAT